MRVLLALTLAACLQVDPASQDASGPTDRFHLDIHQERIKHGDNPYSAHTYAMEFAGRKETFGSNVKLEKDKPLKDKAPLVFSKIEFKFYRKNESKTYNCKLGGDDSKINLQRMIPFDLDQCENQQDIVAKDPLSELSKSLGLTYEKMIDANSNEMPFKVKGVSWDGKQRIQGKIFHHYTYKDTKNEKCELDIWVEGEKNAGAVRYLEQHKSFISKTGGNIVIKGTQNSIFIRCRSDGFEYFGSNAENAAPLVQVIQPYGHEPYSPPTEFNSHLYLSSGSNGVLSIVAALSEYGNVASETDITASAKGREACIFTAQPSGTINDLICTRTVVLPFNK